MEKAAPARAERRLESFGFERLVAQLKNADRLLGAGLRAHTYRTRFLSCIERPSQCAAEIIILSSISLLFVGCLQSNVVPFERYAIPQ
jgi:hypothetical protein